MRTKRYFVLWDQSDVLTPILMAISTALVVLSSRGAFASGLYLVD